MNLYVDTHIHIYDEEFDRDRGESIKRAIEAGVTKMIMPGIDSTVHSAMMKCASDYPDTLFPCAGLHPTSVKQDWKKEISILEERLSKERYYGVGEAGMDGYWSKEFLSEQKEAFGIQIELASKYDLPVIIHSREATEEIFEVLERYRNLSFKGIFHAFSGSIETYRRLLTFGDFWFGIGGVITYKNSNLPVTVKQMDVNRIILETDAPWLTPVPHRGSRNEASYIPHIAAKIAQVKEMEIEEVAEVTSGNAKNLFKL